MSNKSLREIYLFDASYSQLYIFISAATAHLAHQPFDLGRLRDIPERKRVDPSSASEIRLQVLCTLPGNIYSRTRVTRVRRGSSWGAKYIRIPALRYRWCPMAPVTPCALGHSSAPHPRSLQRSLVLSCLRLSLPRSVPCKCFQLHAPLPRRALVSRGLFFFSYTCGLPSGARILLCARSGHARGARRTAVRISRRCTTECPRRYTLRWRCISWRTTRSSIPLPPSPR